MTMMDHDPDGLLQVDEVGLAYARFGDVIFKATYTPVVSLAGDRGRLDGVIGGIRAFSHGRQLDMAEAMTQDGKASPEGLQPVLDVLPVCNLNYADLAGRTLIFPPPPVSSEAWAATIAHRAVVARDSHIETGLIHAFACDDADTILSMPELAGGLTGAGLALTGFCGSDRHLAAVTALTPAIVTFDDAWLARIVASEPARRLLADLVRRLADRGTGIMVGGIGNEKDLALAVQIGANRFHGPYFGEERLAGVPFEGEELERKRPGAGATVVDMRPLRRCVP